MTSRSILLLAGGRSSRLGEEKAWVEIGGQPIIRRLLDAARAAGVTDRVIAVRDAAAFGRRLRGTDTPESVAELRIVADGQPDLGPVAGLAAGLAEARGDTVVVLAGDLPFVDAGLIEGLLVALEADPEADCVVPTVAGRDQPLCAAYRRTPALDAAEKLVAGAGAATRVETSRAGSGGAGTGGRGAGGAGPAVAALLDRLRVRRLDAVGSVAGPELAARTRGVDTLEDLVWARGWVARDHHEARDPRRSV